MNFPEVGGGPAFPHEYKFGDGTAERHDGMTLRDYFAAKAMEGFIASYPTDANPFEEKHIDKIANDFFRMADAMLKARKP